MPKIFVLTLGIIIGFCFNNISALAQSEPSGDWLESKNNWNQPNMKIPQAPSFPEGNNLSNCHISIRLPQLPEDQILHKAGWALTGPAQIYGYTTVIKAMADADGMCRPLKYQVFVFTNGEFSGTLSPLLMDSRTDGNLIEYNLYREGYIDATFSRYTTTDAMCCPSQQSRLFYQIKEQNGSIILMPQLPADTNAIRE